MDTHAPVKGFEELMQESARRVCEAAYLEGTPPEQVEALISDEAERAGIRSWVQSWPNTAGPFSRPGMIAGQAITAMRVVAVQIGQFASFYADGRYLYTLDLSIEQGFEHWSSGQAPNVVDAAELRAEWDR